MQQLELFLALSLPLARKRFGSISLLISVQSSDNFCRNYELNRRQNIMAGSKLHFRSTRINCIILGYWTFTKSWSLDTSDFWHVWIYSCLLKTSVGLTFELTPIPVNGKPFTARWNFQLLPILNSSACTCYYDVLWAECFFLNFFF